MAVVTVKVFNAEENEEATAQSALSERSLNALCAVASSFSSALKTLTVTTAMTLPDLVVRAAEAESVRKISRRAFARVAPCGRQTDHSLKVFSLSRDFIENRGRGHRAASSQWCGMAKKGTSSNPAVRAPVRQQRASETQRRESEEKTR